eukprot:gene28961-37999_t
MLSLLIQAFVFLCTISYCDAEQFCASITPDQAAGASGFVAMDIEGGSAFVSVNLDLTNYALPAACPDISKGLNYHIHSYWKDDTRMSSANANCGASFTGGHYDPNFACGPASQSIATICPLLNRTKTAQYTYNCNYKGGDYSSCEVGDISGKIGSLQPTVPNGRVFTLPLFIDFQPAYVFSYNKKVVTSLPWQSIVFHCPNAAGTRLVCAQFSPKELGACQSAFDTFKHCPLPTAAPTVLPSAKPTSTPTTDAPSIAPTTAPSSAPTFKPSGQPSPLPICQFGGYCRSDWDCYAGNKCNIQSAYYSQCIANPITYAPVASGCVSNYAKLCSATSKCCDPGAYCDLTLKFPQCHQPTTTSSLCANPTGY